MKVQISDEEYNQLAVATVVVDKILSDATPEKQRGFFASIVMTIAITRFQKKNTTTNMALVSQLLKDLE